MGRDFDDVYSQNTVIFTFSNTPLVRLFFYTGRSGGVAGHPLREVQRASHNELFPGDRGGDRGRQPEQVQKPVAPARPKSSCTGTKALP
jgi:hypothetical protein